MKRVTRAAAALAIASAAVIGVSTPAQAASAGAFCSATSEVCRVTLPVITAGPVTFSTNIGPVSSATAQYTVNQNIYGAAVCSGTMGYHQTKSCGLGGYVGQVTFTFYKGQGVEGNITISGTGSGTFVSSDESRTS